MGGAQMRVPDQPGQQEPPEERALFTKLMQRVNECTRSNEQMIASSKPIAEKATKKATAQSFVDQANSLFEKFDADKDGFLNRREVLKYAQTTFDFKIPETCILEIWKQLVEEGDKS